MRYVSTARAGSSDDADAVDLEHALYGGPAPDGGLYVPEPLKSPDLPPLPAETYAADQSIPDVARPVARFFFGDDIPEGVLDGIVTDALNFPLPLVPIPNLESDLYCLELFHGPTFAFKDVGARFMARLLRHFAERRHKQTTVLVATSGDTGSAVAHAFHDLEAFRVVVLFPKGKVSALQQKLFTTLGGNVASLAIAGNFDDCQRMVKRAFRDPTVSEKRPLVSANSINVGRLLPQSFYHFYLVSQLPDRKGRKLIVTVPSGNFGNLTAGLMAKRLGLPVESFVAATNENDVVPSYLATGQFEARPSRETLSNAMDVGDPSNFARMLWLYDDDWDAMRRDVSGSSHTDADTLRAMTRLHDAAGYLADPHTAVAYLGASKARAERRDDDEIISVFLGTAHPGKFQNTVERAIGEKLELPRGLTDCLDKDEQVTDLPPDYEALRDYLTS